MPEGDTGTVWFILVLGVVLFVFLFGAIVFFTMNQRSSSSSSYDDDDEEYIRCPECNEKIRESSSRCKYCDARID